MARGQLRIYLGAAPGVGKTYAMLGEGRRRMERGTDVVVGWVDTHGRPTTAAQLEGLEVLPRRKVPYRGAELEEMDLQAVLDRRPAVALVDELAHTNVPGSPHAKRWQDIEVLLAEGIDVISTVNIQHLASLNDVVERITGIVQRETVPDEWVRRAGQIELVDMTPEALRRRMAHGNIYPAERIDAALGNYFRPGNLAALRELALLWLADRVEEGLQGYMEAHGIDHAWETRERIVVAITGAPGGEGLLRRAARIAQRARGELIGVHVLATDGLAARDDTQLDLHRRLLLELGGRYAEVVGDDVAETLVAFARAERATQLVLGASGRRRWRDYAAASVVTRVIRAADEMDVHVISTKRLLSPAEPRPGPHRRRAPGPSAGFSRRRWVAAWTTLAVGLPVLTGLLVLVRDDLSKSTVVLLFLLPVVLVTALGGTVPGLAAAAVALLFDLVWFIPPYGTLRVAQGEDVLALVVFLVVSVTLGMVFGRLARRSAEARQARAEAEALARLTVEPSGEGDALAQVLDELRLAFRLDGVGVFTRDGDAGWSRQAASGDRPPASADDGEQVPLDDDGGGVVVVVGARLTADDRRVLHAFAARLWDLLEDRRFRAELREAETRRQGHGLRTALLRAVSQDLRVPLGSIKASVSDMERGLDGQPPATRAFVRSVAAETDRLDGLVQHLIDLSHLDGEALEPASRVVGLGEVVRTALARLSHDPARVSVHVPEDLPSVVVDPVFLARAISDIVANAVAWSPPDHAVRIEAGALGGQVLLQVVDHGPAILRHGDGTFAPLPLPGDEPPDDDGARPGLAADQDLLDALGGELRVEETPGGGTTVVIVLDAHTDPAEPSP